MAIAVAFLLWGFLSTATLSSASSVALGWTMQGLDWFFVLIASGFVVFAIWLAVEQDTPGAGDAVARDRSLNGHGPGSGT